MCSMNIFTFNGQTTWFIFEYADTSTTIKTRVFILGKLKWKQEMSSTAEKTATEENRKKLLKVR